MKCMNYKQQVKGHLPGSLKNENSASNKVPAPTVPFSWTNINLWDDWKGLLAMLTPCCSALDLEVGPSVISNMGAGMYGG